jgi:hypothetical protein
MDSIFFSIVFIAFFAIARAVSKTRLGNCALLTLFLLLGTGMIWNARANQHVLKEGQRTTARVVYSTICESPFMGRIIYYRYPGADRRNPLHLFNLFSVIGSQQRDVGTAVEIAGLGGTLWKRPETVTVAYLPNNPRAHVLVEYCSTEVFYGAALLCLAASVWVVLNLLCLIRDERSARPPWHLEADLPPNRIQPLSASPPTLPQVAYDTATNTRVFQKASP